MPIAFLIILLIVASVMLTALLVWNQVEFSAVNIILVILMMINIGLAISYNGFSKSKQVLTEYLNGEVKIDTTAVAPDGRILEITLSEICK